jgi:hypothetical protein
MPRGWLVCGVFFLFLGVVYTGIGKSYIRFQGWVYRSEEPKEYWWSVAIYYLLGICFIVADAFDLPRDFLLAMLFVGVFVYLVYLLVRWVIRQSR